MVDGLNIYDILKLIEGKTNPVEINGKYVDSRNAKEYTFLVEKKDDLLNFTGEDVSDKIYNYELTCVNGKYILREYAILYKNICDLLNAPVEEKKAKSEEIVSILDDARKTADINQLLEILRIYNAVNNYISEFKNLDDSLTEQDEENNESYSENSDEETVIDNDISETPIIDDSETQETIIEDKIIEPKEVSEDHDYEAFENINVKDQEKENIYVVLAKINTINPNAEVIVDPETSSSFYSKIEPEKLIIPDGYKFVPGKGIVSTDFSDYIIPISKIKSKESEINDIRNSTDISVILPALQTLNPDAEILLDPVGKSSLYCNVNPKSLKYPDGFYYNAKNGLTNKHNTDGLYFEMSIKPLINQDYVEQVYSYQNNYDNNVENAKVEEKEPVVKKIFKVVKQEAYSWKDKISKKIIAIKANSSATINDSSPAYNSLLNELDDIITFIQYNGAEVGLVELSKFINKVYNYRDDVLSNTEKNIILKIVNNYRTSLANVEPKIKQ